MSVGCYKSRFLPSIHALQALMVMQLAFNHQNTDRYRGGALLSLVRNIMKIEVEPHKLFDARTFVPFVYFVVKISAEDLQDARARGSKAINKLMEDANVMLDLAIGAEIGH